MSSVIPPGATIGVLGGGQLGRMFAIAARRLGYRVHTLAPEDDTPTGQIADVEINASYDDLDAVRAFARGVDVVTFEFENVPAAATAAAEEFAIVRPGGHALFVTQHRIREKTLSRGARAAGHAVRAGSYGRRTAPGHRAGRLPGGAENGELRLRRQGAGAGRAGG